MWFTWFTGLCISQLPLRNSKIRDHQLRVNSVSPSTPNHSMDSPCAKIDEWMRRMSMPSVVRCRDPACTVVAGLMILSLGIFLRSGHTISQLASSALALAMATSLLFRVLVLGGSNFRRRSSKEQAQWFCNTIVANHVCDAIDAVSDIVRHRSMVTVTATMLLLLELVRIIGGCVPGETLLIALGMLLVGLGAIHHHSCARWC